MNVNNSCAALAAALASLALSGGEVAEKYYRLAIREIRGGDIVQLAEFSLYAADGSRVNGGGMKLVEPRAADKLFDGDPKTKFCAGRLALRQTFLFNGA